MTIDQILDRYVEIGIAQEEALFNNAYAKFNRLFDEMSELEKELKARGSMQGEL